jgi:hypothetical protein
VLSEGIREALVALAALTLVGIVSGRDLDDVRAKVGLEETAYAHSCRQVTVSFHDDGSTTVGSRFAQ